MDEGFTKYIQNKALLKIAPTLYSELSQKAFSRYEKLAQSGEEEPQTTHSDRYETNAAYHIASYAKGELFLIQLEYIIGREKLEQSLKEYFEIWKFKHPTPADFKRIVTRVSGIHLEWYFNDWTQTTKTIDYAVADVRDENNTTWVSLKRIGEMPMPIELKVEYRDSTSEVFYIPFRLMRGAKQFHDPKTKVTQLKNWAWSNESYKLKIERPLSSIKNIYIDTEERVADLDNSNNYHDNSLGISKQVKSRKAKSKK